MRTFCLIVVVSAAVGAAAPACAQSDDAARDQHAVIGVEHGDSQPSTTSGVDTRWYREAGLGMFIHWGISSVDGKHDLSWGMMTNCPWMAKSATPPMTPEAYFRLADRFDPQKYDPEKWLRAAKEAGFGYAVLTARHHDGYAMWPSAYGDFGTRTKLGGRDLLRPYVDACRKVGLKVGLYYSPPDWHFDREYRSFGYGTKGTPQSPHLGLKHEPVQLPEKPAGFEAQYIAYLNGQLTELLTHYGKIDLLWFDGSAGPKVLSQDQIRALQPGILINDRQHHTCDFMTTGYEANLPKRRPTRLWEHCFPMTTAWGYLDNENCQPATVLLTRLAQSRTWGGNVLASFAPRPDGQMAESTYRCLDEMKAWMAQRRESVVGVEPGPYPQQCSVPVTIGGKTWYLFLLPKSGDGDVSLSGVDKPRRVAMLGTGQKLDHSLREGSLSIKVPKDLRTKSVDVIAVEW